MSSSRRASQGGVVLEPADPKVLERIQSFTEAELERIILELTAYSTQVVGIRAWWVPRRILPRGYDPGDLALEAISRVLTGRRAWDPEAQPDFLAYLKGVVDSLLSHLLDSEEQKRMARPTGEDEEGDDLLTRFPDSDPLPDVALVDAETNRTVREGMLAALKDEEEELVFYGIEEGKKPAEIAEDLQLSVDRVYQVKRNIQRRLAASTNRGQHEERG